MKDSLDINKIKESIAKAGARWEAEENFLTRLSHNDRLLRLGYVPGPDDPSLEERESLAKEHLQDFETKPAHHEYPKTYDLRNVNGINYITSVKDQGECGSCVPFAVGATAEGSLKRQTDNPNLDVDYSEAHLFFCYAANEGRNCKNGWWTTKALEAFLIKKGVVDEGCFPYPPNPETQTTCIPGLCSDWITRRDTIAAYSRIGRLEVMKQWISTKGPLITSFPLYEDLYYYNGGIYRYVYGRLMAGHAACVVGYDDNQRYWICKIAGVQIGVNQVILELNMVRLVLMQ